MMQLANWHASPYPWLLREGGWSLARRALSLPKQTVEEHNTFLSTVLINCQFDDKPCEQHEERPTQIYSDKYGPCLVFNSNGALCCAADDITSAWITLQAR